MFFRKEIEITNRMYDSYQIKETYYLFGLKIITLEKFKRV